MRLLQQSKVVLGLVMRIDINEFLTYFAFGKLFYHESVLYTYVFRLLPVFREFHQVNSKLLVVSGNFILEKQDKGCLLIQGILNFERSRNVNAVLFFRGCDIRNFNLNSQVLVLFSKYLDTTNLYY